MAFGFLRAAIVGALALLAAPLAAHITWTQVNTNDYRALGMYHLNDTVFTTGAALAVDTGWNTNRNLAIQAPTGSGFSSAVSGPEAFFGTALRMNGAQRADSTFTFGYDDPAYVGPDTNGTLPGDNTLGPDLVDKDQTIEFWLKWDDAPTSSSVEIGLRSGSKLRVTRDTVTPANDQLALVATHGTTVAAPGFTNWVDVGDDEAPLNEWLHFAVAIESTGSSYDVPSGHWRYNAGTVARFYLNGHEVGTAPHTVSLAGSLDFHSESSLLTVRNVSGVVTIDEVAIWGVDLSASGTAVSPFANGRGNGNAAVRGWDLMD